MSELQEYAPLSNEIKQLNRLGHKLRRPREVMANYGFNNQAALAQFALSRTIGPDQSHSLLAKQLGDETLRLAPSEYEDLPPNAQARMIDSFARRAEHAWIFVTMDREALQYALPSQVTVEDYEADKVVFQAEYLKVAEQLGLFPFPAQLDTVLNQRILDHRTRVLAAKFMFIDALRSFRHFQVSGAPLVAMISEAVATYEKADIPTLQSMVAQKGTMSEERLASLQSHGLWNTTEPLAYMCADRGLRDAIIDHYGIFRDVRLPVGSGYKAGQTMLATAPVLRNSLRVSAKEE